MSGFSGVGKKPCQARRVHLQRDQICLLALIFLASFFHWKPQDGNSATSEYPGAVFVVDGDNDDCLLLFSAGADGGSLHCRGTQLGNAGMAVGPAGEMSRDGKWLVKVVTALTSSIVLGIVLPIAVFELCAGIFHFPISSRYRSG